MAAALATRLLADKFNVQPSELSRRHIIIQSAGLHASRGSRASPEAVQAVKKYHADLTAHISQPVTVDLLRRADFIYTMTNGHRNGVLSLLPTAAGKVQRLDPSADVDDPIGGSLQVYQDVADHLAVLLKKRISELPL